MGKTKKLQKRKKENLKEASLLIGFLSIVLLHIIGGFWHSYYSWGFSYWSVLPNNLALIFGFISLSSLFLVYTFRNKLKLKIIDKFQSENHSRTVTVLFSILITAIVGTILYYFRSKAHVYGDGYAILDLCSTEKTIEIFDQHNLQLLAIYWHQFIFKLLSPIAYFDNEKIFSLTNAIGGLVGLWGIYKITGLLARTTRERLFFILISLSSASIILFFGYIENYTWAMSIMMWSIYYSLRYMNNKSSIFPLLISSLIGIAFHMITLPVLVTALFVVLYKAEKTKKLLDTIRRIHLVGYVIVGSMLILLVAQIKEMDVFVPLWSLPQNNYHLFSLSHLSDIANLLLLLAPSGLFFFLIALKGSNKNIFDKDKTEFVLFIISFLTFLSACVIDPHLGMIRDFDLFSFYGIPLTLWGGYRFSRTYTEKQFPNWIIVASLIVVIVHIVPNIYEKNHPQIAVEYLDTVLWEDPHYQSDYQDAYRGNSWGVILRKKLKRNDLAEKYYTKRLKAEKRDYQAFYNLGLIAMDGGDYFKAKNYLIQGSKMAPEDPRFFSKLANLEFRKGDFIQAEEYARHSISLDSSHTFGMMSLGIILSSQNKFEKALICLREVQNSSEPLFQVKFNLGVIFAKTYVSDSAYFYLEEALDIAPNDKKPFVYASLITFSQKINLKEKAIDYFNQLKSSNPNSPLVKIKEKEIYGK